MQRLYVFFFQAEDGIRDLTVTGVQTCALPISRDLLDFPRAARGSGRCPVPSAARGKSSKSRAAVLAGGREGPSWELRRAQPTRPPPRRALHGARRRPQLPTNTTASPPSRRGRPAAASRAGPPRAR